MPAFVGCLVLLLRRVYQPAGACSILVPWSHRLEHLCFNRIPSGPRTPTAHFAVTTTLWPAGVAGIGHSPQSDQGRRPAAKDRANLGTVLENPGLLIPQDPVDDDRPPDLDPPDPGTASRRLADVFVPRGPSSGQEAWDFSITSAFRMGPSLADPHGAMASLLRLSPTKTHPSLSAPRQASLSAHWSWWEVGGPTLFVQLLRGSQARRNDLALLMALTQASGKTRARCTRTNGFSLLIPGPVSLDQVRIHVISLLRPCPGPGLFGRCAL